MSTLWNLLTADVKYLQELLSNGAVNSTDLVEKYVGQIKKYDHYLHAMISITPQDLLDKAAKELDEERKAGKIRGPLHGIPIIIKDNIATHPSLGLRTTAGNWALYNSKPARNAKIVNQLLDAGAIIIGKSNLSELSNWKGMGISSGWSAVGGQTQSAYVRGGVVIGDSNNGHSNPSGSSAGSAVVVSAGYCPVSIGTETDGSLIAPSARASVYTIKPTVGVVSQDGIVPVSPNFDSAGPIAKTPYDIAIVLDVIIASDSPSRNGKKFTDVLTGSFADLRVGTLDPAKWTFPESFTTRRKGAEEQIAKVTHEAYGRIKALAKAFYENVDLISPETLMLHGQHSEFLILLADHKPAMNKYLASLAETPVSTLGELIEFNKTHADKELPEGKSNQALLEASEASNLSPEQYDKLFNHMRNVGREKGIDKVFLEYDLDVIIGPGDSMLFSLAAAAGYPIAAMPLDVLDYNGRPFGVAAVARAHEDMMLVKVMHAWYEAFGERKVPDLDAVVPPSYLNLV